MKKLLLSILVVLALAAGCTCQGVTEESPREIRNDAADSGGVIGPPVIELFAPRPSSIIPGEYSVLMWSVSGATSVSIDQGVGDVGSTGRAAVFPKTTTLYTLTASNTHGTDTARTRVIVIVGQEIPEDKPVIVNFIASPATISPGQPVVLNWNVSNASTVTPSWKTGTVPLVGHEIVFPPVSAHYTITATNQAGSTQATVDVTVSQAPPAVPPAGPPDVGLPTISYFKADPVNINAGQSTVLSWNVLNATEVTPSWKKGTVPTKGHEAVSPVANVQYILTATNPAGSTQATVNVIVTPAQPPAELPVINSFKANLENIVAGQEIILSWDVSNATTVTPSWKEGTVPVKGHEVLTPWVTSEYTLTATNQAGSTQAKVKVMVTQWSPQKTVDIPLVSSESGTVTSNGFSLLDSFFMAGDTFENVSYQAFLSFDISGIPAGAKIKDVVIDFSDYHQLEGNPFNSLGCIRGYPQEYGMPDAGDFFVGVPLGAIIKYCSVGDMAAQSDLDVLNALQTKVGSPRLKIRLQFQTKTDANGNTDMVSWSKWHHPKMTVTYILPVL